MASTIQNAAHLEIDEHVAQFGGVESMRLFERIGCTYTHHVQSELGHFPGFVFDRHGPKYTVYKSSAVVSLSWGRAGLAACEDSEANAGDSGEE